MGFWISLILWAAVAALLLYGWFYNMGQHRETTKDILVTAGSCIVSLWALRRFLPGPAVSGAVAAAAAAFLLAALVPRTGRLIPRSAAIASAMVIVSLLLYILDKFAGLSAVAVCAAGAVAFVALYALTLRVYARRAAKRGDD